MQKETLVAISGCSPDEHQGVVNTPVYRASTVLFSSYEELERVQKGDFATSPYGRFGTRTSEELEKSLAKIEGADRAIVTASGLSAIWIAMSAFLAAGDHILVVDSVYGPVRTLCDREFRRFGIQTTYYDPALAAGIEALIQPNTKVVYVESPGSLTFEMQDIPAIAEVAHARGIVVLSDSTWATPLYSHSFAIGVDVSIHSGTKYIGGHSDLMLGVITCKDPHSERLLTSFRDTGACASADTCYLAQRGLHTMAVRLKQHDESSRAIAAWLQRRPDVDTVLHPALPGSPGHEIWKRDLGGGGGLFSFVLKKQCSRESLSRMLDHMSLFGMGYSWGGFESLIIPFDPRPIRQASRWPYEGQAFRVHVGLEQTDDLIEDLDHALQRLHAAS